MQASGALNFDFESSRNSAAMLTGQNNGAAPGILPLICLSILAASMTLPQIVLAGYALSSAEIRNTILANPGVSFQITVALVFWVGIFAWPVKGLLECLWRRKAVQLGLAR